VIGFIGSFSTTTGDGVFMVVDVSTGGHIAAGAFLGLIACGLLAAACCRSVFMPLTVINVITSMTMSTNTSR